MANRLDLQAAFEEILGSRNVYFNPPPSVKMKYDAIRYALGGYDTRHASNKIYRSVNKYECVVITRDPETTIPNEMMSSFEMCSFGRPYTADNLHHYPFTIYY
jgi:hypothetical protein